MAKYRHRVFEMYEFRDEAIAALMPKSARPVKDTTAPESWTFKYLAVSRSTCVTLVEFQPAQNFGEETVSDLRVDSIQLADRLTRDSKVLLDLAGVASFNAASIDTLKQFRLTLQAKGSRMALCCLNPVTRDTFLPPVA